MNKKLLRVGPYADFFSQGVQVGNILTLAGQVAVDDEGNTPNDLKEQMTVCYENIKNVLRNINLPLLVSYNIMRLKQILESTYM